MLYIALIGRWCDIIVLNVYAQTEDNSDYMKDNFYEELQCVFNQFLKNHVKILLGEFSAKIGRKCIFRPTIGNEGLHKISNNRVRVVNLATSKNSTVKSTILSHHNIHKYTWASSDAEHTTRLIKSRCIKCDIQVQLMFDLSEELTVILTIIWKLQKLDRDWGDFISKS
jgi:hypothetical protein